MKYTETSMPVWNCVMSTAMFQLSKKTAGSPCTAMWRKRKDDSANCVMMQKGPAAGRFRWSLSHKLSAFAGRNDSRDVRGRGGRGGGGIREGGGRSIMIFDSRLFTFNKED